MLILPKLHCLLFLKLKNIELRFHFLYSHQCVYKFDNLYQFSLSSWCGLMVPISVFIYLTTFTSSAHPFEVVWLCWVVQFIITHHVNFTSQVGMCCVNIVMFKLSPQVIHTCVMTPTSSPPSSIVTKHAQSHPCTYAPPPPFGIVTELTTTCVCVLDWRSRSMGQHLCWSGVCEKDSWSTCIR